jgi:hypothetical protein
MKLYKALKAKNVHRVVYHDQSSKDRWVPLMTAISDEWGTLETRSVLEGIRDCTLSPLTPRKYAETTAWAHNNGLKVRLVKSVKKFAGFSNYYEPGDDFYVTAIGRTNEVIQDPEAHLGYPECCQQMFAACFPTICDPVWQWATGFQAGQATAVSVLASPYSDPTLRYSMIRFVPHIPCNPNCPPSIEFGRKFESLMSPELRDARLELLTAPHSWDCYRSMAIVKTTPFRLIVGSVPAAERYIVNVA